MGLSRIQQLTRHSGARALLLGGFFAVLALLIRLLFLSQYESWPLYDKLGPIVDSRYYLTRARWIASGSWVGTTPHFLSPLYCYALGILMRLFGGEIEVVRIAQAVLGALSCALVFGIGRRLFGTAAGAIAAAVMCFYGLHIYYTAIVLPTTLELFVNLLFLYVMVLETRPGWPTIARYLCGGLLIGLAAAAKPNALLLVPVALLLWFALERRAQSPGFLRREGPALALLLGVLLAVAPFAAHNYAVSGKLVLISANGARNFYKGNGPDANGTHSFVEEGEGVGLTQYIQEEVDPERIFADNERKWDETWDHIRAHPGRALALLVKKAMLAFNARELSIRDNCDFAARYSALLRLPVPGFGTLAPIGLIGLFHALRKRRSLWVHGLLAVQVATLVLLFVLARYRIVAVACLALFAGDQLVGWLDAIRARAWRSLAMSLSACLVAAAFVHWPFPEFPKERGFAHQYIALAKHYREEGENAQAAEAFAAASTSDWGDLPATELKRAESRFLQALSLMDAGEGERGRKILEDLQDELHGEQETRMQRLLERVQAALAGEAADPLRRGSRPPEGGESL